MTSHKFYRIGIRNSCNADLDLHLSIYLAINITNNLSIDRSIYLAIHTTTN